MQHKTYSEQSPYSRAEALAALWRLGGDSEAEIPLSGGGLDRALEQLSDCLEPLMGELSFSNTAVGRRCLDLPAIIFAGQDAMVIEVRAPRFVSATACIGRDSARQAVVSHGITTAEASELGRLLRQAALSAMA